MRLLIFHLLIPIVVASPESAATLEERQWPEVYTPSIPTLEYTICSAYEGLACNWPPGERRCCGDEDDGSYLYCGWWNRMRVGWCDCEFGALCVYLTNPPLWSSCQIPPHPTHCGLKKEGWVSNRELYIIEAELEWRIPPSKLLDNSFGFSRDLTETICWNILCTYVNKGQLTPSLLVEWRRSLYLIKCSLHLVLPYTLTST